MRKLIIHPGWSKTGTSAIQHALVSITDQLKERGILYPTSLQQIDLAHHKFALAFKASGPYSTNHNKEDVIKMAINEMKAEGCNSLIISSELSPLYFDYPEFRAFVDSYFDYVEIIFTIRSQSDCLKSLFSQLVTDPNVRYRESLFFLFTKNIDHLNYYSQISRWSNVVDKQSVRIIPYSKNVVGDFLDSIDTSLVKPNTVSPVHASINPLFLLVIQDRCGAINDPNLFRQRQKQLLQLLNKAEQSKIDFDTAVLFSGNEQFSVDQYYKTSNALLTTISSNQADLLPLERRKDVLCYTPLSFKKMLTMIS
jgi:hypothetical protein